ncbi:hypothetical protein QZH41_019242, partial [Actinostola sp. cb2023]
MLKMTEVKLELLSDADMLLMIESGVRGGISMISKRYAKANNKYIKDYDGEKKSTFIKYLDANNLYGWAMSEPLPTDGFKWMNKAELKRWSKILCILEVDLEYPEELHELHNEYPLAPERLMIQKVEKLVPNLMDKKNYVVHHKALKLYEFLGMKITKVHRGVTFQESDWLKKYISLNTGLRTNAKNNFEKDFFKLMNNSVFDLSKTLMYEFHYVYIKPKYKDKIQLLFTDTDSLMYEIETEDFYRDIEEDIDSKFDTRHAHGSFYAKALSQNLTFEITLPQSKEVTITSDNTKAYTYSLSNIELEYECIVSDYLAREALSAYQV